MYPVGHHDTLAPVEPLVHATAIVPHPTSATLPGICVTFPELAQIRDVDVPALYALSATGASAGSGSVGPELTATVADAYAAVFTGGTLTTFAAQLMALLTRFVTAPPVLASNGSLTFGMLAGSRAHRLILRSTFDFSIATFASGNSQFRGVNVVNPADWPVGGSLYNAQNIGAHVPADSPRALELADASPLTSTTVLAGQWLVAIPVDNTPTTHLRLLLLAGEPSNIFLTIMATSVGTNTWDSDGGEHTLPLPTPLPTVLWITAQP